MDLVLLDLQDGSCSIRVPKNNKPFAQALVPNSTEVIATIVW